MLNKEDIDRLKEVFVTKENCDKTNDAIHQTVNKIQIELASVKVYLKCIIGIGAAIGVPVLSIAVKYLFGGN